MATGNVVVLVVGLTGNLGTGKTTCAGLFAAYGVPVFDMDACVRDLYAPGGSAVERVLRTFPGVMCRKGGIDRNILGDLVERDSSVMGVLEGLVHPLVYEAEERFVERNRSSGERYVVLDAPLLFESRRERRCDVVIVTRLEEEERYARVRAKTGMTKTRFHVLSGYQMDLEEKCRRADFVVDTSRDWENVADSVREIKDWLDWRIGCKGGEEGS